MDKPFFIMMYNQKGTVAMPITDSDNDDQVAFYATEEEALDAAEAYGWSHIFGFEIFEMGTGVSG